MKEEITPRPVRNCWNCAHSYDYDYNTGYTELTIICCFHPASQGKDGRGHAIGKTIAVYDMQSAPRFQPQPKWCPLDGRE